MDPNPQTWAILESLPPKFSVKRKSKEKKHILRLVMNFGQNLPSPTIVRPVSYRAKTSIYFNLKDSPSIKPN